MTSAIKSIATVAALPGDFADLVNLLNKLTEAKNSLGDLNQRLNAQHLETVRNYSDEYKRLQTEIGAAEAAILVLAERNPQWFEEKKTLTTPFGEVKRTTSTSLVIPDEAVTITLIRAAKREADFLVVTTDISREALEKLDDAELAKYGVSRKTEHNFKPDGATVDLGKSVKAAEKSAAATAKAAKKAKQEVAS